MGITMGTHKLDPGKHRELKWKLKWEFQEGNGTKKRKKKSLKKVKIHKKQEIVSKKWK